MPKFLLNVQEVAIAHGVVEIDAGGPAEAVAKARGMAASNAEQVTWKHNSTHYDAWPALQLRPPDSTEQTE